MKKTLIVTAHPSPKGLTHGIANVLKDEREEKGGNVEIFDLYKTDLKQDFLKFEDIHNIPADPVREIIQGKIKDADELIFIHPVWWLSMPAIMKNFVDHNISARFAYRYINGKRVGLLKGKTSRVYVTGDAPFWLYLFSGFPLITAWGMGILAFSGIRVDGFTIICNRCFKSDVERGVYLQKLKRKSNNRSIILSILTKISDLIQ